MKVIAISGHAQNGKDTVASLIKKIMEHDGHTVLVAHYADLLKYICHTFLGWNGEKDDKGRHLLQYVGTDVIRQKAPNYWVDFIISILKIFDEAWEYVLIPDSRFPNEIDRLKDEGFNVVHVRVKRGGNFISPLSPEQQRHSSETALDNYDPDYIINNDKSIDELEKTVDKFVKEVVYE